MRWYKPFTYNIFRFFVRATNNRHRVFSHTPSQTGGAEEPHVDEGRVVLKSVQQHVLRRIRGQVGYRVR